MEFNDLGYGVEISQGDQSVFFQGDDADRARATEEEVCKIWSRRFGKGYRKTFGPFKSYEEHLDAVFDGYFN